MNYRHQNQKDFKYDPPEENSGELIVETAGYQPAQDRIEDLILAGQRLQLSRAEQYDFPGTKPDEEFFDPTRARGFDMADAFQLKEQLKRKRKEHEEFLAKSHHAFQEAQNEVLKPQTGVDIPPEK